MTSSDIISVVERWAEHYAKKESENPYDMFLAGAVSAMENVMHDINELIGVEST